MSVLSEYLEGAGKAYGDLCDTGKIFNISLRYVRVEREGCDVGELNTADFFNKFLTFLHYFLRVIVLVTPGNSYKSFFLYFRNRIFNIKL